MLYTCDFCGGYHNSRNCKLEKEFSNKCKPEIGKHFEKIISERSCPICNKKSLHHLNDNTPSLDCFCKNCHGEFEIKSKCLSCDKIPTKIIINHGNYNEFKNRLLLNIIIIIYGVNRKKKSIYIRDIIFISYIDKIINNNIKIVKNKNENDCKIIINDYYKMKKILSNEDKKKINTKPIEIYIKKTFHIY